MTSEYCAHTFFFINDTINHGSNQLLFTRVMGVVVGQVLEPQHYLVGC